MIRTYVRHGVVAALMAGIVAVPVVAFPGTASASVDFHAFRTGIRERLSNHVTEFKTSARTSARRFGSRFVSERDWSKARKADLRVTDISKQGLKGIFENPDPRVSLYEHKSLYFSFQNGDDRGDYLLARKQEDGKYTLLWPTGVTEKVDSLAGILAHIPDDVRKFTSNDGALRNAVSKKGTRANILFVKGLYELGFLRNRDRVEFGWDLGGKYTFTIRLKGKRVVFTNRDHNNIPYLSAIKRLLDYIVTKTTGKKGRIHTQNQFVVPDYRKTEDWKKAVDEVIKTMPHATDANDPLHGYVRYKGRWISSYTLNRFLLYTLPVQLLFFLRF